MYKLDITSIPDSEKPKNIDDFICKICSFILLDPYECEHCGTPYCRDCIEAWHQRSSQCPIKCGPTLKIKPAHRFIKKMLGDLIVKCTNEECPEFLNICRLDYHISKCEYTKIKCGNHECNEMLFRKNLLEHMETCKFKEFHCEKCDDKLVPDPSADTTTIMIQQYTEHDCIKVLTNRINELNCNYENIVKNNETFEKSINELKESTKLLMSNISYKCDNAHPLLFKANWTSTCSCCGLIKICTRWECITCKKNYCLDCIKLLNYAFCPNYHTFLFGDRGNFLCDICGAKKTTGGPLSLHDPVCDFDVCDYCVQKLFPNLKQQ